VRHDERTNLQTYRFAASIDERERDVEVLAEISFHRYDVSSLSVRLDILLRGIGTGAFVFAAEDGSLWSLNEDFLGTISDICNGSEPLLPISFRFLALCPN
jgi:hypothetical protein